MTRTVSLSWLFLALPFFAAMLTFGIEAGRCVAYGQEQATLVFGTLSILAGAAHGFCLIHCGAATAQVPVPKPSSLSLWHAEAKERWQPADAICRERR